MSDLNSCGAKCQFLLYIPLAPLSRPRRRRATAVLNYNFECFAFSQIPSWYLFLSIDIIFYSHIIIRLEIFKYFLLIKPNSLERQN